MVTLTFIDASGKEIKQSLSFQCSLEDATINGSNIAEDNGWELVSVDED